MKLTVLFLSLYLSCAAAQDCDGGLRQFTMPFNANFDEVLSQVYNDQVIDADGDGKLNAEEGRNYYLWTMTSPVQEPWSSGGLGFADQMYGDGQEDFWNLGWTFLQNLITGHDYNNDELIDATEWEIIAAEVTVNDASFIHPTCDGISRRRVLQEDLGY